jgi:hypothetical protein
MEPCPAVAASGVMRCLTRVRRSTIWTGRALRRGGLSRRLANRCFGMWSRAVHPAGPAGRGERGAGLTRPSAAELPVNRPSGTSPWPSFGTTATSPVLHHSQTQSSKRTGKLPCQYCGSYGITVPNRTRLPVLRFHTRVPGGKPTLDSGSSGSTGAHTARSR